ncbi:hypothetical protein Y032_0391g569 [Ancylostoma ceylanicum]|uniref:Uncharacterized protein n=1 Tax=Ancylostoma ceylanicum TaxID=53326 RepID=A0A016RT39_9BILA|nr:hypothetical protein Y032_0391g569 [Ancylostoma ceylanicum]
MATPPRQASQQGAMNDEETVAKEEPEDPEKDSPQNRQQETAQPLERIERLLDGLHGKVENVTHDVADLRARVNYCMDVLDEMAPILKKIDPASRQGNSNPAAEKEENPLKVQMLAAAAAAGSKASAPSGLPNTECIFCSGAHWATECSTFKTLTARRRRLFEKKINASGA